MMKCAIIRDLFPSYIDNLTSEESNQAIEEHLKDCKECRQYLETMKEEIISEEYNEKEINPFKKIRKATKRKILVTILICIALFGAYQIYFENSAAAKFDDVRVSYEKTGDVVTIGFLPQNDRIYIDVVVRMDGEEEKALSVRKYRISPFRRPIRVGGYYGVTFVDENTILDPGTGEAVKLTGEETFEIEFADTTKEVRVKDLYTEEGIKQIK